jgi:hypothetical protein
MFTQEIGTPIRSVDVHLLTIHGHNEAGLKFSIFRYSDRAWNTFHGLVFDINGFMHFFGEGEIERDIIIFTTGRLPLKDENQSMSGYMVSVNRGRSPVAPMAWKIALVYKNSRILKPESFDTVLGKKLSMDKLDKVHADLKELFASVFSRTVLSNP